MLVIWEGGSNDQWPREMGSKYRDDIEDRLGYLVVFLKSI